MTNFKCFCANICPTDMKALHVEGPGLRCWGKCNRAKGVLLSVGSWHIKRDRLQQEAEMRGPPEGDG